mgnify:CR=1 FL=1
MLLKELRLINFRQFIGDQSVLFSTDTEKNVSVIMGENGSGKTTLAQAFTWCLYGDTDFEDKNVLNKIVVQSMLPNSSEIVKVELTLIHNGIEYTVIREQKYAKDAYGILKRPGQTTFSISYKTKNGQRAFVKDTETEFRMKEILPRELSRYFFFDGERIEKMSKEIRRGKSNEFAQAVKNLLGLSAFTATLEHLKSKTGRLSVIKIYENSYDVTSNSRIADYTSKINEFNDEIAKIDCRLEEIENEEIIAKEKCAELKKRIQENAASEKLANIREQLIKKQNGLIQQRANCTTALLKKFNNMGPAYFAKKLIKDALQKLSETDKLDKGIPDIHARTIEYLIKRGRCICGSEIVIGNETYKHLNEVLNYIPPHSIGSAIGQFIRECETFSRYGESLFEEISNDYAIIRDFESNHTEVEEELASVERKLQELENVGELQKKLQRYEGMLKKLQKERDDLNLKKGSYITSRDRCETERNELALRDANNRKIEVYKAYAEYMYNKLYSIYTEQENITREELEKVVNDIFRQIYNGGFSLKIDEKYNIQVIVDDFEGYLDDVETSTAQSISIIFAFIAGVIKMARKSNNPDNELLVTEPYPLVMDAPLSSFDKRRIKTVCETLPAIAEQVIIFIKDTDGEIAEEYLSKKIGARYFFKKKNEFETELIKR